MNEASLVFGILGFVVGVISLIFTIRVTKKTTQLQKFLAEKYQNQLNLSNYNKNKAIYLDSLKKINNSIKTNISSSISDDTWASLTGLLNQISCSLFCIDCKLSSKITTEINGLCKILEDSANIKLNKKIVAKIDGIITLVELEMILEE